MGAQITENEGIAIIVFEPSILKLKCIEESLFYFKRMKNMCSTLYCTISALTNFSTEIIECKSVFMGYIHLRNDQEFPISLKMIRKHHITSCIIKLHKICIKRKWKWLQIPASETPFLQLLQETSCVFHQKQIETNEPFFTSADNLQLHRSSPIFQTKYFSSFASKAKASNKNLRK